MKKVILSCVFLLLLGGCTFGPLYSPAPPPPEGRATVYFLRSQSVQGQFLPVVFFVNDAQVVGLHDKGYSWTHLAPGEYRFKSDLWPWWNQTLQFTMRVEAGEEYFLEKTDEWVERPRYKEIFRRVDKSYANEHMKKYRFNKPKPISQSQSVSE
jgi:hypothetical protein